MNLGKKGAASEMWAPDTILFWILFGIIVGLSAMFFVITLSKIGSEQAKINKNIELSNLIPRFLKSPSCFVYEGEGITLERVIDADKFNEERLDNCYETNGNPFPAFRITLHSDTAKLDKTLKTRNWNDNREAEERQLPFSTLLHSENKTHNGEIIVEVQNAR